MSTNSKPSSAHYIEQFGYTKEVMDETLSRLSVAFGIDDSPPPERRKLYPHCDCKRATEASGKVVGKYHKAGAKNEMVPTKASRGYCVYCNHAVFMKPLGYAQLLRVDAKTYYDRAKGPQQPKPHLIALWEKENKQPATRGNRSKR